MNEIKVFQNTEFGELSVMTIDGKEYFPATQCAKILGYKDTINAIKQHCKGVVKHHLPTAGGSQEARFIPEGDLYRLIIRSKLPGAEKFERWVFDEVLPSLRKTGQYGAPAIDMKLITEIITKTATAVAAELYKAQPSQNPQLKTRVRSGRVCNYKPVSIIESLNDDLREDVDEMLLSGDYRQWQVVEFLSDHGVQLSQMAVSRHHRKLLGLGI